MNATSSITTVSITTSSTMQTFDYGVRFCYYGECHYAKFLGTIAVILLYFLFPLFHDTRHNNIQHSCFLSHQLLLLLLTFANFYSCKKSWFYGSKNCKNICSCGLNCTDFTALSFIKSINILKTR
jgi:hypothetical protein